MRNRAWYALAMDENLPIARRDRIAARLADGKPVVAATLAAEFGVSEDAIRRDLRALAAEGLCRRVYGGALPVSAATAPIAARINSQATGKLRLARAAVDSIKTGELLFLDSGSTNLALVDLLPEDAELTVATNAVEIAAAVLRRQDLRLIVIGGMADPLVGGCVDAAAVQAVARMRFDRAFIGACSVSAEDGIRAFQFADATFKRAAVDAAAAVAVLATADKIAERAAHEIVPMARVDQLVLEPSVPFEVRARFAACGCRLVIADAV